MGTHDAWCIYDAYDYYSVIFSVLFDILWNNVVKNGTQEQLKIRVIISRKSFAE